MITIQTYRLEPYLAANVQQEVFSTEWLREAVNKLMRDKQDVLNAMGVNTLLFYNHNPFTGDNRVDYPLIIYHYIDGMFYITGINEGAFAIEKLAEQYTSPIPMEGILFQGFRKEQVGGEFGLGIIDQSRTYSLIEWRPINHKYRNTFIQMDLVEKSKELNLRLEKHITNELGKYLKIDFAELKHAISDITRIYDLATDKYGHKHQAFDIRFNANVSLPGMITLGNHQALGFGRVEPKKR